MHEIGLDIAHDGFQRHGAYIAENADMPGFPRAEQRMLAYLIDNQRHRPGSRLLASLPREWREMALRLSLLLRLSVLLNRSRAQIEIPPIHMTVEDRAISLTFDAQWLASNPLVLADLEREQEFLRCVDYQLSFS